MGNHRTLTSAGLLGHAPEKPTNGARGIKRGWDGLKKTSKAAPAPAPGPAPGYQLLTWSARDEAALRRMLHQYDEYIKAHMQGDANGDANFLGDLAYTLAARRTLMTWRSFSVVENGQQAVSSETSTLDMPDISAAKCERAARENGMAFIFTGQGAQYANMGLGLLHYPIFRDTLAEAHTIFQELGAEWSLFGKH